MTLRTGLLSSALCAIAASAASLGRAYAFGTYDVLASARITKIALPYECKFSIDDSDGIWRFDLCPLVGGPARVVSFDSTISSREYVVSLEFLGDADSSLGSAQCSEGTGLCMTDHPNHLARLPNVIPITGRRLSSTKSGSHGLLNLEGLGAPLDSGASRAVSPISATAFLELHSPRGGEGDLNFRSAVTIRFICDANSEEPSSPVFVGEDSDEGVHSFTWTSKHACAENRIPLDSKEILKTLEENSVAEGEEEIEGEKRENEEELLKPPFKSRYSATFILLSICTTLFVLGGLYFAPPPPLVKFTNEYIKPIRSFRVGEVKLLRWADEELGALDGEGEEDVMVNGVDEFAIFEDDENIPLTGSNVKKQKQKQKRGSNIIFSYGTV